MNEFAEMHKMMATYCARHDENSWPSEEIKRHAHRVRLSLWECANNDPPHPSSMESLARETDALAKARKDHT